MGISDVRKEAALEEEERGQEETQLGTQWSWRFLLGTPAHGHTNPSAPDSLSPQKQLQSGLSTEATQHKLETWTTCKERHKPG